MSYFNAFTLSLGAILAATMVLSAWIFRTASAPFAMKLIIPSLLVFLACYAPWRVSSMLGYPVSTSLDDLPGHAQFLWADPHDSDHVVNLWLRPSAGSGQAAEPRAYQVPLTDEMKKTIREAQEAAKGGRPVTLAHRAARAGKKQGGDADGIGDTEHDFWLDFSSDLPPKGQEQ